jgi:hypothetical protein
MGEAAWVPKAWRVCFRMTGQSSSRNVNRRQGSRMNQSDKKRSGNYRLDSNLFSQARCLSPPNRQIADMSPSLPVSDSSLSFWHQTTRSFAHLNSNRDVPVPLTSRYAIIGSGVSGALTAWELIKNGVKGEDILILEATEAVSGATGRNAGHVRPGITPTPVR